MNMRKLAGALAITGAACGGMEPPSPAQDEINRIQFLNRIDEVSKRALAEIGTMRTVFSEGMEIDEGRVVTSSTINGTKALFQETGTATAATPLFLKPHLGRPGDPGAFVVQCWDVVSQARRECRRAGALNLEGTPSYIVIAPRRDFVTVMQDRIGVGTISTNTTHDGYPDNVQPRSERSVRVDGQSCFVAGFGVTMENQSCLSQCMAVIKTVTDALHALIADFGRK